MAQKESLTWEKIHTRTAYRKFVRGCLPQFSEPSGPLKGGAQTVCGLLPACTRRSGRLGKRVIHPFIVLVLELLMKLGACPPHLAMRREGDLSYTNPAGGSNA